MSVIECASALMGATGLDLSSTRRLWTDESASMCLTLLARASAEGVDRLEAVLCILDPLVRVELLPAQDLGAAPASSTLRGPVVVKLPHLWRARVRVHWSPGVWAANSDLLTQATHRAARWWCPAAFTEVAAEACKSSLEFPALSLVCVDADHVVEFPPGHLRLGDGALNPVARNTEHVSIRWRVNTPAHAPGAQMVLQCLQGGASTIRVFCSRNVAGWNVEGVPVQAWRPCPLFPELWVLRLHRPAALNDLVRVTPDGYLDKDARLLAEPVVVEHDEGPPLAGRAMNVLAGVGARVLAQPLQFRTLPPWATLMSSGASGLRFLLSSRYPAIAHAALSREWVVDRPSSPRLTEQIGVTFQTHPEDGAGDWLVSVVLEYLETRLPSRAWQCNLEVRHDDVPIP